MYVVIDGDDSGRKIAACYINNDESSLRKASRSLEKSAHDISNLLQSEGFRIIFCAADGVSASNPKLDDFSSTFEKVRSIAVDDLTFSAGVGRSLQEAYVALLNAKCTGKDKFCSYEDIGNLKDQNS